jgi:hypothetical protein
MRICSPSKKTIEIDDPPRDHWQSQHDTLGMNLYPLVEFAIKETAKRSCHLIDNSVTLGNPNGLNIIHDLLRYHHPCVLDSLAPSIDDIYRKSFSAATWLWLPHLLFLGIEVNANICRIAINLLQSSTPCDAATRQPIKIPRPQHCRVCAWVSNTMIYLGIKQVLME